MMDTATIARLQRLEACEAIRECVYSYALAGDRGNDGRIVEQLFTEDGTYEAVGFGRFVGRANIVRGLEGIAKSTVIWAMHVPGGPLIKLAADALTAKAFWWVWVPVKLREQNVDRPYWGAGHYSAELIADGAQWKFHRLLFETRLQTPFEGPWTQVEGVSEWPERVG